MPTVPRSGPGIYGWGFGPGIDKRANTIWNLGAGASSMPSSLDLSAAATLNEWPFAGFGR